MRKLILLLMLVLSGSATGAIAESVYLKDGTIVRGKITKEDDASIIIESGDTWKRIERSSIEFIKPDAVEPAPAAPPAAQQAPTAAEQGKPAPQESTPAAKPQTGAGFYLGFQIPYNRIDGDFDDTNMPTVDPGIGFGFIIGYSFNMNLGMEIDWAGSGHNSAGADIGFGEFSLNLKYTFRSAADEAAFFLFAGYGSFTLGDSSLTFGGSGYNLGLGVDIPVSKQNTIGIALIRKIITYDEIIKSDAPLVLVGDLNGDTTSIRFDFTHHF